MTERHIRSVEDVLRLLDGLFTRDAARWTEDGADWWAFYTDRDKPVPFFVDKPDENLVSYRDRGLLKPGRALDVGSGRPRAHTGLAALDLREPDGARTTAHDRRALRVPALR